MPRRPLLALAITLPLAILISLACRSIPTASTTDHRPGAPAPRAGDEIVVCGQMFHTGAPVVLWTDPGGYDGYRTERRFANFEDASWERTRELLTDGKGPTQPARYNLRYNPPATQPTTKSLLAGPSFNLTPEQLDRARAGWSLDDLRPRVDQFVLHYDVAGTSRQCFKVLHDLRGLSVHFMLDLDGTIYQTLDLKERAWHATTSNTRSIGIEIAHMGAYLTPSKNALDEWYAKPVDGAWPTIRIPARFGDGGLRNTSIPLRPARPELVAGQIHGRTYFQYDFTPQQYESLTKLTATLCAVFPNLKCDYPRDAAGNLLTTRLPDDQLAAYQGVLGHFHVQQDKQDPGPAMQWDKLITGARAILKK
ncbi:MAG: N-acetylmuramoyl-L-alanine amidase [Phycisphaerae bacterium]|nr:N-acetylmuramoyl-L-alanine amidase [Tepidisphaeraceae bacterium]